MKVESTITKQWRASYEMARNECERLRAERDELKAEYPRCPNCEYEIRLSPRERKSLEAERDALKAALEQCAQLLHSVILDHRDPRSPWYNECDLEDEECLWCERAKAAIDAARGE